MSDQVISSSQVGATGVGQRGEVHSVRINNIIRDQRYQVRQKVDPQQVQRYASAYKNDAALPPIKVARVGDALILVDGWHRLEALESNGVHTTEAEVIQATEREALWLAASANLTHGLPLKRQEVRKAFRAYIKARQHYVAKGKLKSYRDIAQDLGGIVSYVTVRAWMMKDFPSIAEQMRDEHIPKGDGGLMDRNPQGSFLKMTREGLSKVKAAFNGVTDPQARGEVIYEMAELLAEMKRGNFMPYVPDF